MTHLFRIAALARLASGPTAAAQPAAAPAPAPAPTVLITGANRGIGLEFAKQYSARAGG
jgi:hypothetical protein